MRNKLSLLLFFSTFYFFFHGAQANTLWQETQEDNKGQQEQSADNKTPPPSSVPNEKTTSQLLPPKPLPEIYQLDLKHYLPKGAFEDLMLGPDAHTALIETYDSTMPKGVAILLPDWQQPATSPQAINVLRKTLPKQGWTTITLQPLEKPANYPSTNQNNTAQQTENAQALTDYQQKLALLLTASIEKAKSYPGIIIVIAQGQNAAQLLTTFSKESFITPSAYIMLSAYMPTTSAAQNSAKRLSELSLPVLDIYLKKDHINVPLNAAMRNKQVKQFAKGQYRQVEMFNFSTGYYDGLALAKQIQGWLTAIGW